MNNIYSMVVILLVNINFLFGMDLAKQDDSKLLLRSMGEKREPDMVPKIRPIAHCAQILNMPMRDIRYSVEKLPFKQQQLLKQAFAYNFTFNIAILPKELCSKILHFAYDENDQRYNSESFFCTPMIQAIALHREFRDNPIKIGGKEIQFSTFLTLSQEERSKIRLAVNPSKLSRFLDGTSDSVFSSENYETIVQLLPDDLESTQIVKLPSFWQRLKWGLCGSYEMCELKSRVLLIAGIGMLQMPLFLSIVSESKIVGAISGIIDAGIIIGGTLYGISQCRDYIVVVTRAQSNVTVQK